MEKLTKFLTKDRQKQRNLSDILNYIIEKGEATRRDIEHDTGFSWGAVSESVAELLSRGYLIESVRAERSVGRNSTVLRPNGNSVVSIGLDINNTGITARIVGFDLSKKWRKSVPFTAKNQNELISLALSVCEEAIGSCKENVRILSIGIAMQGKVDTENGISMHFPNINDWQSINIKELFEERFEIPTTVEHDPKCLLLAKNVSNKIRDAILLRIDNGIGLSVIQDGKILNDFGRMEIGHTIAVTGGERCTCGKFGCLEAYSSIPGIERRKNKKYEELSTSEDLHIFDEACEYLALAIYNLHMLFAPQRIILTGKLSENKLYTKRLTEILTELNNGNEMETEIDNNISAAFGAALISIKNIIKSNNI